VTLNSIDDSQERRLGSLALEHVSSEGVYQESIRVETQAGRDSSTVMRSFPTFRW